MSSPTVVPSAPVIGVRMLFALLVGALALIAMIVAPAGTRPANMPADPETSATVERLQRAVHSEDAARYNRRVSDNAHPNPPHVRLVPGQPAPARPA